MKKLFASAGVFFTTFRSCVQEAARDTEVQYYIPKSRFKDPSLEEEEISSVPRQEKPAPRNVFLGSFRGCVGKAWEEADAQYHIPKSRFQNPDFNQTAYSASQVRGVLSRVGAFLRTLESCMSTAWKESDHYYHLPKSRYQDPGFVREKKAAAPKPQDRLHIRSLILGVGAVDESIEESWLVKPSWDQPDEKFIVPEDGAGVSPKQEIGPE